MKTLKRRQCAVLPLVLKRRWYDMIASGEKREEYRLATPYWMKRMDNWAAKWQFRMVAPVVEFRLGYAANAPRMAFRAAIVASINGEWLYRISRVAYNPAWGEEATPHYVIALGEQIKLED